MPIHGALRLRSQARLSPSLVTACYLVWALVILNVNPSPYPYNVLHVAPYVVLAALDAAHWLLQAWPRAARPILAVCATGTVAAFLLLAPADAYLRGESTLQLSYMNAAEALTDPQDAVIDAVGLVPSRRPVGRDWMLHSGFMKAYSEREREQFADLILEAKPPVAITNYRWGWLGPRDVETLARYYLALAPDFLVLGFHSRTPSGQFELLRSGRYLIHVDRRRPALIDGRPIQTGTHRLAAGTHEYAGAEAGLDIAWLGPRAARLPALPRSTDLNVIAAKFPLHLHFKNAIVLPERPAPTGSARGEVR